MEQLKLIDKVWETALADKQVRAVLMYGSFTKGEGDQYSDIEFYIFTREENIADKREWISSVHPIDMFYTNEFGTDVVVFDNLIRGEFHFYPATEMDVINTWQGILDFKHRDKMNLVDKDGLLLAVLDNIKLISPIWNTEENITNVADSMINNLLFVGNVIQRGENARAVHLFFYLEKYLASLIRLHLGTTEHWLDPMKGFEEDITGEWYARYKKCIPQLDAESVRECYNNTLVLTKELFNILNVPQHNKRILDKIISKD